MVDEDGGVPVVVTEAGEGDGVGLGKVLGEVGAEEEAALRVRGVLGRGREDVVETGAAPGRYDEHAETVRLGSLLKAVVRHDLLLQF